MTFPLNDGDPIVSVPLSTQPRTSPERGGCGLKHNFMMIEINIRIASAHCGMSQDIASLSFHDIGRAVLTTGRARRNAGHPRVGHELLAGGEPGWVPAVTSRFFLLLRRHEARHHGLLQQVERQQPFVDDEVMVGLFLELRSECDFHARA